MSDTFDSIDTIASQLRTAREMAGLTGSEAAARAGISRQRLSMIENDRASDLQLSTLLRLLELYGLSLRIEPASARPTLPQLLREREREYNGGGGA